MNIWRLNNTLLSDQQINEEIKKKTKIGLEKITMKHDNSKPMGYSEISVKSEVYRNTSLPQETNMCLYGKSPQACPTLCNPIDHSLPGSSVG